MKGVKCLACGKEMVVQSDKFVCCGCPNMTTVVGEKVTAVDLSLVLLLNAEKSIKKNSILSDADLKYQEARRQRRVRKLDFEER